MAEFKFETHPERTLHLLLFEDVQNSKDLVSLLRKGELEPELSLMNAALVPAVYPVLVAAQAALTAQRRGKLASRTVHSELVYNYSGSKHISEALRRWGISEDSSYILAARFDASPEELEAARKAVQGRELDLSELAKHCDQKSIQKYYKITPQQMEVTNLEEAVICHIASRDAQ